MFEKVTKFVSYSHKIEYLAAVKIPLLEMTQAFRQTLIVENVKTMTYARRYWDSFYVYLEKATV